MSVARASRPISQRCWGQTGPQILTSLETVYDCFSSTDDVVRDFFIVFVHVDGARTVAWRCDVGVGVTCTLLFVLPSPPTPPPRSPSSSPSPPHPHASLAPPPFTCTPNIHLHPHPFTCTPTIHLHPRHLASPSSFSTSRASRVFAVASPPSSSRGLVAGKEDAALRSSSAGHHVLHMCCIDDQTPSRVTHDRGRRRKWQRPSPYVRMKSTVQRKNAAP